jgi:hypothetical protein
MRAVRLLGATLNVLIGGYILLIANRIYIAMRERMRGREITPLQPYPEARIVVYLPSLSCFNSFLVG